RTHELVLDEIGQVSDVQQITDLLACPTEADVGKRHLEVMGEHPVSEDTLVALAHLPRTRDHSTAIDDRGQPEAIGILGRQQLARQLAGAIQGACTPHRKALGYSVFGGTGEGLLRSELEARLRLAEG